MDQRTIVGLIFAAAMVLLAYRLGYQAGKSDGHEEGRKSGTREVSIRAYAVGYDRGKRARDEEHHQEEDAAPPAKPAFGCLVVLGIAIVPALSCWLFS
ncbi:MAG: hypothetical protein R3E01_34655 [Pirellulaceae bacterium]|nr:hypothetical protein [Planctomycetales bacterium]